MREIASGYGVGWFWLWAALAGCRAEVPSTPSSASATAGASVRAANGGGDNGEAWDDGVTPPRGRAQVLAAATNSARPRTPAAPPATTNAAAPITIPELVALLRDKKGLRGLTPQMGMPPQNFLPLRRLVSTFTETVHDQAVWEFEGENAEGFVRGVTVAFHPTTTGWRFHAIAVRLYSEDPAATFAEIRQSAVAAMRKPKWTDLGAQGPTGWSLGEGWEFVVGPGGRGEVRLRSGLAPRH